MATIADEDSVPTFRFKRRKVAHPRRPALTDDNAQTDEATQPATSLDTPSTKLDPEFAPEDAEDSVPNLKEILRNRRRPQNRTRLEPSRKPDLQSDALIPHEPPKPDIYSGKFVAQTGQVVDQDDKQMMNYIDARIAEQNHRQYGWPIPRHLENYVNRDAMSPRTQERAESTKPAEPTRMAVGMGRLQEIDLGPEATARNIERTEQARRRLEGHAESVEETPPEKVRLGKDGKPRRRWQKRRNSEDIRRDQMVEAVLRESKLDYFEEPLQPTTPSNPNQDADDALAEQFRREFLDSLDSRHQRKPAPPPGPKGAKEQPKGPKLGGSRSARAMRLQEEQAAKGKK